MRRRQFLTSGSATLACGFFPLVLRAQEGKRSMPQIVDLEKLIPKLLHETTVPGISIALVRGGKLFWSRAFGVRDTASKAPVEENSAFEAASVSKTVFAYAVMKLCERGILGLDTPLTKYGPKPFLEGDSRLDLITARHVLSHSAGFQDWRSTANPLKIHFKPGDGFLYSGEGYFYLQSVVSHMTGKVDPNDCAKFEADLEVCGTDIDSFMKRNLLTPFGMTSSAFAMDDALAMRAARPHDSSGKPISKSKGTAAAAARYAAAGGLLTTAKDFAKFIIEIVSPKESDAFRLTQKSLKEMARPQIELDETVKIDGATSWGLGWAIQERPEGNLLVHSGGQRGFRSLAMVSMEKKSGFIILTNGDNGGRITYDPSLGDAIYQLLGW
jgi:CubicO group peptidase (beta-lactamase class C family)